MEQLEPGECLGQPIYGRGGVLLLAPGVALKASYIEDLRGRGVTSLYIEDDDLADVAPPRVVSPQVHQQVSESVRGAFAAVAEAMASPDVLGGARALTDASAGSYGADVPLSATASHALKAVASNAKRPLAQVVQDIDLLLADTAGEAIVTGLGSLRSHDSYTFDHSVDVTAVGLLLARRARWPEWRLRLFAIGLLLHDIGKLCVDPDLLNKPGRLGDTELERMRQHPALGYRIIKETLPAVGPLPAQVAYQHHERQDGQGYPRGLRGSNRLGDGEGRHIHDFGALAAVADVYDALITDRPYRAGLPGDRVREMICSSAGTHLNTEAVALFEKTVAPFGVCTEVELYGGRWSGHVAVVTEVRPPQLDRPSVRVVRDPHGRRIEPYDVRLADEPDVRVRAVDPAADSRAERAA